MDSPYAANWQGKLREQIDKYPQAAIGVALLIVAAIVLLFTRKEEVEKKPTRKVIRIHERIIERPVHMSRRDLNDDTRSADEKEEKEKAEKAEKEKAEKAAKEEAERKAKEEAERKAKENQT